MHWYALYTKPRWEKKVAKELEELGFTTYCPMVTEVRQWSDRKKKVTFPLFKSYVFIKLSEKERHVVFQVPGVVQYLYWLGKPAVVREAEIETIRTWLEDDRVEDIEVNHLSAGDKLIISKGAFKGREAIISEVGNKRLRLLLKSLNMVVSVRVSDAID